MNPWHSIFYRKSGFGRSNSSSCPSKLCSVLTLNEVTGLSLVASGALAYWGAIRSFRRDDTDSKP